ncbi:MAG: sensor histidine kinase [Firmicutes bacterium]|nr:sensor histidine kinase [Bacillota bacterium]
MKELKYSLAVKIIAFFLLYLSGYAMLVTAFILLVGEHIGETVLQYMWPFSWFVPIAGIALPLLIVISIFLFAFLLSAAGTQKDSKQIVLNGLDRIPSDVITVICAILFILGLPLLAISFSSINSGVNTRYGLNTSAEFGLFFSTILFYYYSIFMLWCTTIVKRFRAQTLYTNSLIYRFFSLLKLIFLNLGEVFQAGLAVIAFGFINIVLLFTGFRRFPIFFLMFNLAVFIFILYLALQVSQIKQSMQQIAAGQIEVNLDSSKFILTFKEQAQALNAISSGLQRAVEEKMRSERFKTELITNVSHDIKTPLTSIINYVDLLKKEELNNEKATAYLDVLTKKSYRLKELIEDLMEASKASTGNITVELTEIEVNELIKQITGEYDERLREKNLDLIQNLPAEKIFIQADRRHMSRILENLFSNIKKYALPKTRVYLDLIAAAEKMRLIIKNISAEKLNISPEELMERFVRGDKSRHTEGSGLGLTIAKSLTELQGGEFKLDINGDLFVVELVFPCSLSDREKSEEGNLCSEQ